MALVTTLEDIRNKVRKLTARPNAAQISDAQIDDYINTFYIADMPEHLQLIANRVNYQFVTNANTAIYDLPNSLYLTGLPPVFIGGYQSYMTQSRENFYRINPSLNYVQQNVAQGNGTPGPYTFTLPNTPIMRGWKRNPPGAYSLSVPGTQSDVAAENLNWMVLISGTDINGDSVSVVDDGQGNFFNPGNKALTPPDLGDLSTSPALSRGSINYTTGVVTVNNFSASIANATPINAQYVPYVASRPMSVVFYQQQFNLYPIPDQAYTVSFEAYALPTQLIDDGDVPNMFQWGQVLAYGAADKIFTDNADLESSAKFRPYLEEQLKLIQRQTIVQQAGERIASIYTETTGGGQFPFGNNFSGF